MNRLTRKEKAKLIAQEKALFAGMRVTVQPNLDAINRFEKEIKGLIQTASK